MKREAHRSSARAPGGAAPPGAGHRHLLRLASALHAASLRLFLLLGVYVSVMHVWPNACVAYVPREQDEPLLHLL